MPTPLHKTKQSTLLTNIASHLNQKKEDFYFKNQTTRHIQPLTNKPSKPIPPLHYWQPTTVSQLDLVIKANGEWWHEGTKMTRQSLIDLFATVLWCEVNTNNNKSTKHYFLKTPIEKQAITVEDAPLLVTHVDVISAKDEKQKTQQWLQFSTQTGDIVIADANHALFMQDYQGEMQPYINIRHNLHALIHRNTFYHLIALGKLQQNAKQTLLTLHSGHYRFELRVDNINSAARADNPHSADDVMV